MTELKKKQKARLEELSNNISERLSGTKPVRNEVTSERGYCRIISVGRAIARSYWYCPQYPILFNFHRNLKKLIHQGAVSRKQGSGRPWALNQNDENSVCQKALRGPLKSIYR